MPNDANIFARIRDAIWPAAPQAATTSEPIMWGGMDWQQFISGASTFVSEADARSVSTVIACTNLIGGTLASMPLHFYRQGRDGTREKYTPPEWWLFNERPHASYSAATMWQFLSDSRLLYGDGIAKIIRASAYDARVIGLEPWHPLLVDVRRIDGRLKYRFTPPGGFSDMDVHVLDQDDVLHIPGAGFNGLRGISQLQYGLRNAAGIAATADGQSANWFADGARPDFAIEVPQNMNAEQAETLRKSWLERHTGQSNKKAPVVLAGGMKLHQLTLSAEDAQLISTRKFQVEEICRVFGVPPHMVGHTEKASSWGTGIAAMSLGFLKYTMQRHLIAFEQEINFKLYKTSRNFVEFLTAGLERADLKTRNEAYRIALGRAGEPSWMTVNEVRKLENLPPIEGGDELASTEAQQSAGGNPAETETEGEPNAEPDAQTTD